MESVEIEQELQVEVKEVAKEKPFSSKRFLDQAAFVVAAAGIFLLPFFFIPYGGLPLQLGKVVFLSSFTLAALVLWIAARLREGRLTFWFYPLLPLGFVIVLVSLLSAIFSGVVKVSFLGNFGEVGTAASVFVLFALAFLVSLLFSTKSRILLVYLSLFASFAVVTLFTGLRLVLGGEFLSFGGTFGGVVSNLIGKWNDLGIFFSVISLLSVLALEFLTLSSLWRLVTLAALVISVAFLAVVNFPPLWTVLAIFMLLLSVYLWLNPVRFARAAAAEETGPPRRPVAALAVLAVAIVFMLFGRGIDRIVADKLQIAQLELRPSLATTAGIAREVLKTDPFFGVGPNRFVTSWLSFKPREFNLTVFWDIDFNNGIGLIPTFLVTTGAFGFLGWLAFLAVFIRLGLKAIVAAGAKSFDSFGRFLTVSSFLTGLFLWTFAFVYIPTTVIMALTFVFTGLFLAAAGEGKIIRRADFSFSGSPRAGFVTVVFLVIVAIASFSLEYAIANRFISGLFVQKSVNVFASTGDLDRAEGLLKRAVSAAPADIVYRPLSELGLLKVNRLLARQGSMPVEELRDEFLVSFGEALRAAEKAVEFDTTNYLNHAALGRVYEAVVPLRVEGAYANASASYQEALRRNPHNPALYLALARLEAVNGDSKKAREFLAKAREEKENYTEAAFFLSQLEAAEGNVKEAIKEAAAASILSPGDPVVHFQLGLLKYNAGDYRGAAQALERAVQNNSSYANARYFLGLSYYKLGRSSDAAAQFEEVKKTNPDNKEVALILSNLKAGRAPFTNAAPPIDDKPERRSELPVEED